MTIKILHILPYYEGGGVESAAKSLLNYSCDEFLFSVFFVEKNKSRKFIFKYLVSFIRILKLKPNIVLTSLWKSNIITLAYKLINYKTKCVLFLHSTKNVHFVDRLVTSITAFFAYEIWADSKVTLEERIESLLLPRSYRKILLKKNKTVISFIKEKIPPLNNQNCSTSFIYWGRLCPFKNIDKAIIIFSKIYQFEPKSKFIIIGPDNGMKNYLIDLINKMKLNKNIKIYDYMEFNQIKKYAASSNFFIQLSSYEGMAMSVCESMQLGLIPIVNNVGEIKNYCTNLKNSLIFDGNEKKIVNNILDIALSHSKFSNMRKNAIKTWQEAPVYKSDVILALKKLTS